MLSRAGVGAAVPSAKMGRVQQMVFCSICSASGHRRSHVSPGPPWGTWGSAPPAAPSSKSCSGAKEFSFFFFGVRAVAGGGCRATYEHLVLCVLLHLALWSEGHCVSKGKKMPRNSTDPSISFLFYSGRQKKVPLCEG